MHTFTVNGTSLVGEERGIGELLILVHGAVGDYRTWENVIADFAEHYRVITYSRRWHHPNPAPVSGEPYTPDRHTTDLIALIESNGGGPVKLLAHSYGAHVCAELAVKRPDLVRCMVLAEPSVFGMAMTNPIGAVAMAQTAAATMHVVPLLRKGEPDRALHDFLCGVIGKDDYARLSPRVLEVMKDNVCTLEPMLNGLSAGLSFTGKQASQITAPTLLVEGAYTTTLFRTTMKALANSISTAERSILPNVGHGCHLEDPKTFSQLALEFLAKH